MAASSSGPPPISWGDGQPDIFTQGRIDGTYTGATLPSYMDPEGMYGELHLLRISGANGPLPNRPFHIRRSVEKFVGGKIEGAFPENNKTTYALKVRNLRQFNLLLNMKALIDGTAVNVTEHPTLNSIRCVVSCRDVMDMPDGELLEELKEQGVKDIRRITRRNGQARENTPAIVLTCRGTNRPEAIDFGYIRCRTRPYYPSPMQCFNCWLFGHTKMRCQAKTATCGTCSGNHPISENKECNHQQFCKTCNTNDHKVSSRSCPLWQLENTIQRVKVDQGVSYPMARRIVEQNRGESAFANIVGPADNDALRKTNERVDQLTAALASKDAEIAELRAALAIRPTQPIAVNEEIAALKSIVADQAKQIQILTSQLSAFLNAVMPAASISLPQPVVSLPTNIVQSGVSTAEPVAATSATTTVGATATTLTVTPIAPTEADDATIAVESTATSSNSTTADAPITTDKPLPVNDLDNVSWDSDSHSSEQSQSAEFFSPHLEKSVASPRTPLSNRPGTPIPGSVKSNTDPTKIPSKRPRGKISRTETLFQQQQQKKSKLKSSSINLGAIPKSR